MERWTQIALVVAGFILASIAPAAATVVLGEGKDTGPNVAIDKQNGPEVIFGEEAKFTNENPYSTSNRVELEPWGYWESSGSTSVRVDRFNGTWTNLSSLDVSSNTLTVDINDKQRIEIQGETDSISYQEVGVNDGTTDFQYAGSSGLTTLTIHGVPASTQIAAEDTLNQDLLDVSTSDPSGVVTFSLPNSQHTVRLTTGSSSPSLSNGQPSGSLDSEPTTVSADISDSDFPYDEVTVEFEIDGTVVGSDTVSSAGTASVDISSESFDGGTHNVVATATDAYGNTDSISFSFDVPSNVTIYNESAPDQKIENSQVDLKFFYEEGGSFQSTTKKTTNGVVNLSGLPVNRPIVAQAEAGGYRPRRIFIESLYEQQSLYLLPENETRTQTTFKLQDFSGDFPQDTTVLKVQRPIDDGNYTTVLGDYFGATGQFPGELAFNERHRLVLLNTETGKTRDLGSYTPLTSGEQDLAVSVSGQIQPIGTGGSLDVDPTADMLPAQEVTLEVTIDGGDAGVDNATVEMIKTTDSGSSTVFSDSTNSEGSIQATVNLSDAANGELSVISNVTTNDGGSRSRSKTFGIVDHDDDNPTIIDGLGSLTGLLPSSSQAPFQVALALVVSIMGVAGAASTFRLSTEVLGLVAIFFLTGFAILGFIGYDIVFVGIVAWVSLTVLGRRL